METRIIEKSWHKVTDRVAATQAQIKYISDLRNDENCPAWPFASTTNAMRSLTKSGASEIIDALKAGEIVIFE
ncbi:MAG: hypothetical protein LBS05_00195 [Tannerellaceae bacterium]|jgi:hypothetical protein|nr:hypothetical protein [Tannerellaceae bacterium]